MRYAILALAGTMMMLGACAVDDRVADRGDVGASYYDGYYDGAYGPFNDGYWGTDGAFYYSSADGSAWNRDDAHHFRHDMSDGFTHVHGRGGPANDAMPYHPR